MRTGLVAVVVLLVAAGAIVHATFQESQVECEICMRFGGREACRTALAADRNAAAAAAIRSACAVLSSGVTQGMQCDRTRPRTMRCKE